MAEHGVGRNVKRQTLSRAKMLGNCGERSEGTLHKRRRKRKKILLISKYFGPKTFQQTNVST